MRFISGKITNKSLDNKNYTRYEDDNNNNYNNYYNMLICIQLVPKLNYTNKN